MGSVRFFCIILWHHHIFRFWRISLSAKLYKNQTSHKLHSCFKLNFVNSTWKDLISFFVYHVSTFRTSSLFLADQFWHHFKIANCSKVSFICLRVIFSFLGSVGKPYDINDEIVEVKQIRCHCWQPTYNAHWLTLFWRYIV